MLEDKIFKQYRPKVDKLKDYGFKAKGQTYFYQKNFFHDQFQAQISIKQQKVSGKVIDRDLGEEYLALHTIERGKFVDQVRKEYVTLLKDIRQKCFQRVTIYPDNPKRYWLTPANPKYFDIMHAFNQRKEILWKQSTKVRVGDIVFLYVTQPYSAVIYQTQVLAVNLPYEHQSKGLRIKQVMRVRLIKKYDPQQFTLKKMTPLGVKYVMGPRHVPRPLLKQLLQ